MHYHKSRNTRENDLWLSLETGANFESRKELKVSVGNSEKQLKEKSHNESEIQNEKERWRRIEFMKYNVVVGRIERERKK